MFSSDATLKQPLLETKVDSKEIELNDWQGFSAGQVFGESAPLTQAGYAAVAELKSDEEMAAFIHRAAGRTGLAIHDTAGLIASVVPYHSGTKATQTFERLSDEMLNAASHPGAWVSKRADGSFASLDQDGYVAVARLRDGREMSVFVLRLAAQLSRHVVDEATLEGLLPFHSGEKATQSFERLSQEIQFSPTFAANPVPQVPLEEGPQTKESARLMPVVRVSSGAGPAQGFPVSTPVVMAAAPLAPNVSPLDRGRSTGMVAACGPCPPQAPAPTTKAVAVGRVVSMSVGVGVLHVPSAPQSLPLHGAQQQSLRQYQMHQQQAIQQHSLRARISEGGLCPKCAGKGFFHAGGMAHDRPASDPCFFCQDCDMCCSACGDAPAPKVVIKPVHGDGAQCGHCTGLGFCHVGGMQHDRGPSERCFFCQDCVVCGGSGGIGEASSFSGAQAVGLSESMCQEQQSSDMPCGDCYGQGFVHAGQFQHELHDRPPNEPCFHCQECINCKGRGVVSRLQQQSIKLTATPRCDDLRTCAQCAGKGFYHVGGVRHDWDPRELSFSSQECALCAGRGYVTP